MMSENERVQRFPSQEAMRSGPRSYTRQQHEFIAKAVAARQPLPSRRLPVIDDDD